MTHVLEVGGDSDWVVLKQVIRLREKTGSGLAEDRRKQNYGDPEVRGQGPRERGTVGQRAGDRDPEKGGDSEPGGGQRPRDPERGDQ